MFSYASSLNAGLLTLDVWAPYDTTFTYDDASDALTTRDGDGNVTTDTYDGLGDVLTEQVQDAYDAQDRLTSQTDPLGLTLTYAYDAASRVTQRVDSLGGVLTYVYDTANRLTSEQFGGAGQTQARVDLGYDNRDELTGLTRYTDVAGSNLVGTTVYAYDASQRLTAITDKTGGAATLSYYDYMLDNAGRVTQESWQSENTTGGTIGGAHTYSYDATSQLTAADGTVYNYDPNGNQTGGSYQTGSANRLTNDGTWTYTYDNVGDLIEKSKGSGLETWYYGYDTLNRLTSVEQTSNGTTAELTATYGYDVYNHRIEEDDWQTGGTVTVTKTAYDGDNAWVDTNGSGAVQTRYLWGPGVDQLLGRSDASGDEWLLTDRLGSVRDVVGSAGTLVLDHAEYQAFGGVASDTAAAAAGKYGSEGEREDRTTGLVQSGGVRVDDTQTHQWMQEDPTGFDTGDGNDPTNATDPTGLFGWGDIPGATAVGGFFTTDHVTNIAAGFMEPIHVGADVLRSAQYVVGLGGPGKGPEAQSMLVKGYQQAGQQGGPVAQELYANRVVQSAALMTTPTGVVQETLQQEASGNGMWGRIITKGDWSAWDQQAGGLLFQAAFLGANHLAGSNSYLNALPARPAGAATEPLEPILVRPASVPADGDPDVVGQPRSLAGVAPTKTQTVYTVSDVPIDVNRLPRAVPADSKVIPSRAYGGTYVVEKSPLEMTSAEFNQFVRRNWPNGMEPKRLSVIEVPEGGVNVDPSVPKPEPGTGHVPPNGGAKVVAEYEITYDQWGMPTFKKIQGK